MNKFGTVCPEFGPFTDGFFTPCFVHIFFYGVHGIFFTLFAIYHLLTKLRETSPNPSYFLLFVSVFCSALLPVINFALLILQFDSPSGLYVLFYSSQTVLFLHLLPLVYYHYSHSYYSYFSHYLLPFTASYLFIFGFELQIIKTSSLSYIEATLSYFKFFVLLFWTIVVFVSYQNNKKVVVSGEVSAPSTLTKISPENEVNMFYLPTFFWVSPLMTFGHFISASHKEQEDLSKNPASSTSSTSDLPSAPPPPTKIIKESDIWDLPSQDNIQNNSLLFEKALSDLKAEGNLSIPKAIWRTLKYSLIKTTVIRLFTESMQFGGPIILTWIVGWIELRRGLYVESELSTAPVPGIWYGLLLALAMFVINVLNGVLGNLIIHRGVRDSLNVRSMMICSIYRKSFRLTTSAGIEAGGTGGGRNLKGSASKGGGFRTMGEIMNLMSVDTGRFDDLMFLIHYVWAAPAVIIVCLYLLYRVVGIAAFIGFITLLILLPVNVYLARRMTDIQKKMMTYKDLRSKGINEMLQGIRVVKFFNWELSFFKKIDTDRTMELGLLFLLSTYSAINQVTFTVTPTIVSLVTFASFSFINGGDTLTPGITFSALALMDVLRIPVLLLPRLVSSLTAGRIAAKRIETFLTLPEIDTGAVTFIDSSKIKRSDIRDNEGNEEEEGSDIVISITNGGFGWLGSSERNLNIKDINLQVKQGELVAIIGPVGCGKSTLLNAILGNLFQTESTEIILAKPQDKETPEIGYVSQTAWIQNQTVRNNICFGMPFDSKKYKKVVKICELKQDLDMLPAGDQTEIGEKGINLSGGQKQRIAIARALYSDADILLFDDPLSAVDAHVGNQIFFNAIHGKFLKHKTKVLVTHQIQHLPYCDRIFAFEVDENGHGTLIQKFSQDFEGNINVNFNAKENNNKMRAALLSSMEGTPPISPELNLESQKQELTKSQSAKAGKTITIEERAIGSVDSDIYVAYIRIIGGFFVALILFIGFTGEAAFGLAANIWLSIWSGATESDQTEQQEQGITSSDSNYDTRQNLLFYLGIYAVLCVSQVLFLLLRQIYVVKTSYSASVSLHKRLLQQILLSPLSFFDTTPVGRILNRFTKDIAIIDEDFPRVWSGAAGRVFNLITVFGMITYIVPVFLSVFVIPLGYIYFTEQRYYLETSRELKRLESVSRSPLYAHFGETLSGLSVIRAFAKVSDFIKQNIDDVNLNMKAYYSSCLANRWMITRTRFYASCSVGLTALFCVLQSQHLEPGFAGLALAYSLTVSLILSMFVRESSDLENQIVSVERVVQYLELEQEKGFQGRGDDFINGKMSGAGSTTEKHTEGEWPRFGRIELKNVKIRYRNGLPLVLKGLTCNIEPGEKVGVVGRTGAGKSSLMLALFRIVELEQSKSGQESGIWIDSKEIRSIPLETLRQHLSIIPQDPILFAGTIRTNLDPFHQYTDEEIWTCLKRVTLKNRINSLSMEVKESGENWSVGQRQLLCLARALLKNNKILIMDEATAAVDFETDKIIQETIREEVGKREGEEGQGATVLTIAHRLNTIMDYDKVMVLDKGKIAEFDSPRNLLADENGIFYSMVNDSKRGRREDNEDNQDSSGTEGNF